MKKLKAAAAIISLSVCATAFTGCDKSVKPGEVAGYDEGEQNTR